ncbi:MAG: type IV pilus assembly protein PilM [Actinobacteria bacterium]|nr:type IV pilus assembly protein PilM [Actinomycetota bacterium]MCL5446863.1 type IV pilus assembly protein PilM [Actinomycetota bacterium]
MARIIGLDIGTSGVRAVELEVGAGSLQLYRFMQVAIAPGSVVSGEVHDVQAVASAIRRLFSQGDFSSKTVTVGLAGLRVITREIEIPWVPDDEVEGLLQFQAQEVLPFPVEQVAMGFQVLSDFAGTDGTMKRRVLIGAAHKDVVKSVVAAVEAAGLDLVGIDLVPFALVRALGDPSVGPGQLEAAVSVGAGLTVLVVHEQGRAQFIRTMVVGGDTATMAISSSMDMPFADAEVLKRHVGMDESPQAKAAAKPVETAIRTIAEEISNSLRFYSSLPGRTQVSRILVTGAGARLNGFLPELQAQAGIPVVVASPLSRLDMSQMARPSPEQLEEMDAVIATAAGLVEPDAFPGLKRFNLVPPEVLEKAFQRRLRSMSIAAAIVLVVLIAGVSFWRYWQVHTVNRSIASVTASMAKLSREKLKLNKPAIAARELQSVTSTVHEQTKGAVDWAKVVDALNHATDPGFVISQATGTGGAPCSNNVANVPGCTPNGSGSPASIADGIGTMSVTLEGPTTNFKPASYWLNAVSSMFNKEKQSIFGAVTNSNVKNTNGIQTFTSTIVILPPMSLSNDPAYG